MTAGAAPAGPGRHIPYYPFVRLMTCTALAVAIYLLIPAQHSVTLRALVGWDAGVFAFIAWALVIMSRSTPDHMRRRAALQDQGRTAILAVIVGGALISLAALAFIQKLAKTA